MTNVQMRNILNHVSRVKPGAPFRFTRAATIGDTVAQGDLYVQIIEKVPEDYVRADRDARQLVPGSAQGARHCVRRGDIGFGVEVFRPRNWPESAEEDFNGPVLVVRCETVIEHPVHGNVTLCPGRIYQTWYQRSWDAQQRKERRQAD